MGPTLRASLCCLRASAFRFIIHLFKIYREAAEIAEERRGRIL
jgi:hypothetical protein